jgi:hypothetical protein
MRSSLALSFLLLMIAACGGSQQEAKAPTTSSADVPRDGSPAPAADLPPDPPKAEKNEPVKTSAVSHTDDGSDIIPPFTAGKDDGKKPAPTKAAPKKKGAAKPKKKT